MKNQPLHRRIGFALAGLREAWRREKSFRAQVLIGLAALAVTALIRPGLAWVAIVALAIALVLALELVNAAIEYMIDHVHPDIAPEIRRAKDVAAAAVLVASAGALVVGGLMILDWLLR